MDFPDWRSAIKPINHTETKAKEVNPKKISTYINQESILWPRINKSWRSLLVVKIK